MFRTMPSVCLVSLLASIASAQTGYDMSGSQVAPSGYEAPGEVASTKGVIAQPAHTFPGAESGVPHGVVSPAAPPLVAQGTAAAPVAPAYVQANTAAPVAPVQTGGSDMFGQPLQASQVVPGTAPAQPLQASHVVPGTAPAASQFAPAGYEAPHQVGTLGGNPMMQSLLDSVTGDSATPSGARAPLNIHLSQDSTAVVSGLVEEFMHKQELQAGEKSCLERNMATLTGDVMGTVGDIVTAVKALIEGKGKVQQNQQGGLVSAGIDSAMKITSLVAMSTQLFKNCVHGDALILLKRTAHHLINGTYLEHRFLVNGVDIVHSLSDSVVAFESNDFHRFGKDMGFTLRKILLSTATGNTGLPEGVPDEDIIQKAFDGLMKGFFVSGSAIEVTDTAAPDVDMVVNLHQCIAGNSALFKELWMAAWNLIAQLSVNGAQHEMGELMHPKDGKQPAWQGELMIAMMQIPTALTKCGVAADMEKEFMEAIKTLGDVKVQVRLPDHRFRGATDQAKAFETTQKMAKAVADFTNWDFEGFGYEIGTMLRELVMLAFPQQSPGYVAKYSMDASGKLRRYVKPAANSASTVIIGGAVVSMLLGFVAVRARRSPLLVADQSMSTAVREEGADALE